MFSVSRFVIALKVLHEITTSTSFLHTPSSFPSGVSKIVATSTATSNPYERESQIFAAAGDDEKEPSAKVDDGSNEETTASSSYDEPTDRFKYKVHALMGDYDPIEGTADDEDQDGNIMKALITFSLSTCLTLSERFLPTMKPTKGTAIASKPSSMVPPETMPSNVRLYPGE